MRRAICRCGQPLSVPANGSESARVVCPNCGARVRIRHPSSSGMGSAPRPDDGYIRFFCPCGRRLKVSDEHPPSHGKCPDCGAIVPVPRASSSGLVRSSGDPETPTAELSAEDLATLERWTQGHLTRAAEAEDPPTATLGKSSHPETPPIVSPPAPPSHRAEVGLRVCPSCHRAVHLGAEACRDCGTPVPRR